MKLTKAQLKRIIKEELEQVLEIIEYGADQGVLRNPDDRGLDAMAINDRIPLYQRAELGETEVQTVENALKEYLQSSPADGGLMRKYSSRSFERTPAYEKLFWYFSHGGTSYRKGRDPQMNLDTLRRGSIDPGIWILTYLANMSWKPSGTGANPPAQHEEPTQ